MSNSWFNFQVQADQDDEIITWRYDQIVALGLFFVWMVSEQVRRVALRCSRHVKHAGKFLRITLWILLTVTAGSLLLVLGLDIWEAAATPSIFTVVTGMVLAQLVDRPTPRPSLPFRSLLQGIFTADETRFSHRGTGAEKLYVLRYDPWLKIGPNGSHGWEYHERPGKKRLIKDVDFARRADPTTKDLVRQVLRGQEGSCAEVALGRALLNWLPAQAFDTENEEMRNIEPLGQWNGNKKLRADRRGMIGVIHGLDQDMDAQQWVKGKRAEFYGLWFHTYGGDGATELVTSRLKLITKCAITAKEVVQMLEASMWEIGKNAKAKRPEDMLPEFWGLVEVQRMRTQEQVALARLVGAQLENDIFVPPETGHPSDVEQPTTN